MCFFWRPDFIDLLYKIVEWEAIDLNYFCWKKCPFSKRLSCIFIFVSAGMANRTTLVDNNTWNNSHIALVGKAMSSPEEKAYEIMRMLDVDYVLVIFGGMIGYSGDDINKFLWMVRIAQGEHPNDIQVIN